MEIQENKILVVDGNDLGPLQDGLNMIINKIKQTDSKICIFLSHMEYALPGGVHIFYSDKFTEFKEFCKNNQIRFIVFFGAVDDKYYEEIYKICDNLIEFIHYPTFYLHYTFHTIYRGQKSEPVKHNDVSKLYLLLNNRPHYHRQLLIDELCKNKLLDHGIISWNKWTKDFLHDTEKSIFECWEEKILNFDNFQDNTVNEISTLYNETIQNVLINLTSESNTDCQFISEKTWKPLLSGQIFLCYGSINQNKILLNYGFKLYDELFNYDFDSLKDHRDRCMGIIHNLNKLKNSNYNELLESVKSKIIYNQNRCYELLNNDIYLPKQFRELYKMSPNLFENKLPNYIQNLLKLNYE